MKRLLVHGVLLGVIAFLGFYVASYVCIWLLVTVMQFPLWPTTLLLCLVFFAAGIPFGRWWYHHYFGQKHYQEWRQRWR